MKSHNIFVSKQGWRGEALGPMTGSTQPKRRAVFAAVWMVLQGTIWAGCWDTDPGAKQSTKQSDPSIATESAFIDTATHGDTGTVSEPDSEIDTGEELTCEDTDSSDPFDNCLTTDPVPDGALLCEMFSVDNTTDDLFSLYRYAYDEKTNLVSTTYDNDAEGLSEGLGGSGDYIEIREYDAADRLVLETRDSGGDGDIDLELSVTYDSQGRLVNRLEIHSSSTWLDSEEWRYYKEGGGLDRVELDDPRDGAIDVVRAYNEHGDIVREERASRLEGGSPRITVWTYLYDVDARILSWQRDDDEDGTIDEIYTATYRSDGTMEASTDIYYRDANLGIPLWTISTTYDASGIIATKTVEKQFSTATTTYQNGEVLTHNSHYERTDTDCDMYCMSDEETTSIANTYDEEGRLLETVEHYYKDHGDWESVYVSTEIENWYTIYHYDNDGYLRAVHTDYNGQFYGELHEDPLVETDTTIYYIYSEACRG